MSQHLSAKPGSPRLLLIDNYDSFSYNLVQGFAALGAELHVYRNDEIEVQAALALQPTHLVISPGPGRPDGAGQSLAMIEAFAELCPVLGVCLGHQCMIQYYGGDIVAADRLMHGKTSRISHDGLGVFKGIDAPMQVGRYHSLCARSEDLPDALVASAHTSSGELMAIRHREKALHGVQFHPESVLTPDGMTLMSNFLQEHNGD